MLCFVAFQNLKMKKTTKKKQKNTRPDWLCVHVFFALARTNRGTPVFTFIRDREHLMILFAAFFCPQLQNLQINIIQKYINISIVCV